MGLTTTDQAERQAAASPRRRLTAPWRLKPRGKATVAGWALVLPAVLVLLCLTIFPAIYLLVSSFYDFHLLALDRRFVGFDNYVTVLTNAAFRQSLWLTLAFVAVAVGLQVLLGIALAVPLSRQTPTMNLASTLLLLPLAVTPAVSALVARQLLNPNYGWIEYYMQRIGLTDGPVSWLASAPTAWTALIALDIWQWTPFVTLIIVAGMTGLPHEPREAAAVDGADAWQAFWHVTLPMLMPFIAIAAILRAIQAFKTFDSFKVLTDGGPGVATEIVNLAIYRVALQSFRVGAAATLGIFFLIVLLILVPRLLRVFGHDEPAAEGA